MSEISDLDSSPAKAPSKNINLAMMQDGTSASKDATGPISISADVDLDMRRMPSKEYEPLPLILDSVPSSSGADSGIRIEFSTSASSFDSSSVIEKMDTESKQMADLATSRNSSSVSCDSERSIGGSSGYVSDTKSKDSAHGFLHEHFAYKSDEPAIPEEDELESSLNSTKGTFCFYRRHVSKDLFNGSDIYFQTDPC
jgi:hypothetical protein